MLRFGFFLWYTFPDGLWELLEDWFPDYLNQNWVTAKYVGEEAYKHFLQELRLSCTGVTKLVECSAEPGEGDEAVR